MAVFKGKKTSDTFTDGAGSNTYYGYDGNDRIDGRGGSDKLYGGNGNDTILGGDGNDMIDGGNGNDKLSGQNHNDRILGGDGNDTIDGGTGNDKLSGGAGNDRILGGDGIDYLYGESGNDSLSAGNDDDWVYGGAGNDRIWGDGGSDVLMGGAGKDTLYGNGSGNKLYGEADADTLSVGIDDYASGGTGNDLFLSEMNGELDGTDFSNFYDGGSGTDTLRVANNLNDIDAFFTVTASTGMIGSNDPGVTDPNYSISLGQITGFERIEVTGKNGVIYDGRGVDMNMVVVSNDSEDRFIGGPGDEIFDGKGGHDTFTAGGGNNTFISGNDDRDVFYLGSPSFEGNSSYTTVKGFNGAGQAGGDTITIDRWDGSRVDPDRYEANKVELNGHTIFQTKDLNGGIATLDIPAVGLTEWVDYFWV